MMYDWANSAYSVIIVTLLPIFYSTMAQSSASAMARWGTSTSAAMLIIALLAPFLGVLGDFQHWRKRLFTAFVLLGAIACLLLAPTPFSILNQAGEVIASPETIETIGLVVLILYILATIGFAGANVYYDSFLLEVTTPERMDRVSLMGFGLGYIGGSTIPLLIFLVMNLLGVAMNICLSVAFGLTAVWWCVFTIPMWKNVRQTHFIPRERGVLRDSLRGLGQTLRAIVANRQMLFFLIAYFFYIDGVGTIIHMSTVYGNTLGIDSTQMMLAMLVVQLLGLPFAMVYTKLAGKFGARAMVGVGICIYMCICVFGFFVREAWHFWVLAVMVSTSQGGVQALSRSIFGKMVPEKKRSGEYFGFYDIFSRFSAILGPALMGWVAAFASRAMLSREGLTEATAGAEKVAEVSRQAAPYGVLSVLIIFIIGAVLYFIVLPRVEKKSGVNAD